MEWTHQKCYARQTFPNLFLLYMCIVHQWMKYRDLSGSFCEWMVVGLNLPDPYDFITAWNCKRNTYNSSNNSNNSSNNDDR